MAQFFDFRLDRLNLDESGCRVRLVAQLVRAAAVGGVDSSAGRSFGDNDDDDDDTVTVVVTVVCSPFELPLNLSAASVSIFWMTELLAVGSAMVII